MNDLDAFTLIDPSCPLEPPFEPTQRMIDDAVMWHRILGSSVIDLVPLYRTIIDLMLAGW